MVSLAFCNKKKGQNLIKLVIHRDPDTRPACACMELSLYGQMYVSIFKYPEGLGSEIISVSNPTVFECSQNGIRAPEDLLKTL